MVGGADCGAAGGEPRRFPRRIDVGFGISPLTTVQPLYDVEVSQVWQTPFDRGSLELLAAAAIDLSRELLAT